MNNSSIFDLNNPKHLPLLNNLINESWYAYDEIEYDSNNQKLVIPFALKYQEQKSGKWWSVLNTIIKYEQQARLCFYHVTQYDLKKDQDVQSDIFNVLYDIESKTITIESFAFKTEFIIFASDFHVQLCIIDSK